MLYTLAGLMIGAILTRIVLLLKRRTMERQQMAARLDQLAL